MRGLRGFTLLELLMVVIIIGILASIALPQYLRSAERARAAEALQLLSAIRSAEARFRAQDPASQYTQDFGQLDVELPNVVTAGGVSTSTTASWTIRVSGTAPGTGPAGPNAEATRIGTANKVYMDLNTGNTCADRPGGVNVYGLDAPGPMC